MPTHQNATRAVLWAGIPALNAALYHRLRFQVGDPAAVFEWTASSGQIRSTLIVRDIEIERARRHARVDRVACPADFTPPTGLSGDRETATAQATAQALRQVGVRQVLAHRSLPLLFAHVLTEAGLEVVCDPALGVLERRAKDEQEIAWLRAAQSATEEALGRACRLIAQASAAADGVLWHDGAPLTSERVRALLAVWLLEQGYLSSRAIVAGGPAGADCHFDGGGPLRTGEPVIVDVFPRSLSTLYNGDCTRTVVHGEVPSELARMHAAVVEAKQAATALVRPGTTGEEVHAETCRVIRARGYEVGLPSADAPAKYCALVHGTGHGIGLEAHEPPLLDRGGPALVVGDALTIEPGLYCHAVGGVRVEDMVIVTDSGCENLNRLPEGLDWRSVEFPR